VFAIHHHGIIVPDLSAAKASYLRAGAVPVGETYRDPVQQAHICFLQMPGNATLVELVAPYSDSSPVAPFLARYGGGLHHICYMVNQLRPTVNRLRLTGALPVFGPEPAVAFRGQHIAFLYLRDRSLVELVEAGRTMRPAALLAGMPERAAA
jgi:methylmalonyl-CoA/ethylmalonyl-CoA epimerase